MHYRHLIEGCFAKRIGTGGASAACFADSRAATDAEHQRIRQTSEPEMAAVLALPEKTTTSQQFAMRQSVYRVALQTSWSSEPAAPV